MSAHPDPAELLRRLDRINPEEDPAQLRDLRTLSLAASLLHLAEIDHEREYQLCAALAAHLLGELPEAEELDLGGEEE